MAPFTYRNGEQGDPFSSLDRDVLAYALRALKWSHRRVMLHHGLLIATAPLTPMERRLVNLLPSACRVYQPAAFPYRASSGSESP